MKQDEDELKDASEKKEKDEVDFDQKDDDKCKSQNPLKDKDEEDEEEEKEKEKDLPSSLPSIGSSSESSPPSIATGPSDSKKLSMRMNKTPSVAG